MAPDKVTTFAHGGVEFVLQYIREDVRTGSPRVRAVLDDRPVLSLDLARDDPAPFWIGGFGLGRPDLREALLEAASRLRADVEGDRRDHL
ncbi:hypothetical protein [Salininema proteolyticum]|uniref:Uncharacterized protein n=1 Tax=Salininema proteolyticum TaxID=1607685 RepID=A0ABV8TYK3_9ACTN